MNKSKIYHFDKITGEFVSEGKAQANPLVKGEYFLPAYATIKKPIKAKAGYACVYNGGKWEQVEDNRGKVLYRGMEEVFISYLGVMEEGLTEEPVQPAITWDDIRRKRDKILRATDYIMLNDVPVTAKAKKAAEKYRQELRDLPQDFEKADKVVWPVMHGG